MIILPQKRFFVKHFFEKLLKFFELKSFSSFSVLTGTFERSLVLFKGFLLGLQKSFFCLSAWRSHIVPYRNHFCKPFLHFFRLFLRFVYISQFFAQFQGMFWPFFHHFCAKTAAAQKVQRLCGVSPHSQRSAMIHHIPGRLIRPSRCSNTISMVFSFQTVRFSRTAPLAKTEAA